MSVLKGPREGSFVGISLTLDFVRFYPPPACGARVPGARMRGDRMNGDRSRGIRKIAFNSG